MYSASFLDRKPHSTGDAGQWELYSAEYFTCFRKLVRLQIDAARPKVRVAAHTRRDYGSIFKAGIALFKRRMPSGVT